MPTPAAVGGVVVVAVVVAAFKLARAWTLKLNVQTFNVATLKEIYKCDRWLANGPPYITTKLLTLAQ